MIVNRFWFLNGYNVVLAGPLYDAAQANRTPDDFWGLANSISCPRGQEPGSAWVLVTRALMDALDVNARHTLTIIHENGRSVFPNLVMRRAICMGKDGDGLAPYLIEFQDVRCLLKMTSISKEYNLIAPAALYTDTAIEKYHNETVTDDDEPYTWQTMLDHVWGYIHDIAGDGPTLPYEPEGTPENFRFLGMSAWDAVGEIMQAIGCEIVYNIFTGEFTVVQLGVASTINADLVPFRDRLLYDYRPKAILGNIMPETIRVFFPRRERHRGTEHETPRSGNWEIDSYHSIDVATNSEAAESGSVLPIWDTMPATFDFDGAVEDETDLQARADEVADNKIAEITVSMQRTQQHYSGVLELIPRADVTEIVWRDFDDGDGLITEIRSAFNREETAPRQKTQTNRRHLWPNQLGHRHPGWPQYLHVVEIGSESEAVEFGEPVEPNEDGFYQGYVVRFDPETGAYEDPADQDEPETCWIREVNAEDLSPGFLVKGDRYHARLCGSYADAADGRALFLIRNTITRVRVRLLEALAQDGVALAELMNDTTIKIGVHDWLLGDADDPIDAGVRGWAQLDFDGIWYFDTSACSVRSGEEV